MAAQPQTSEELLTTPLHALHVSRGAKMVPFAGYDMPVQYPDGVLTEHKHTREAAGLFDVSHMGQVEIVGPDHAATAAALEALMPGEIAKLGEGRMRYSMLLNDAGGIIDDLMVARMPGADGTLNLVINAACKHGDIAYMQERLPDSVTLRPLPDLALVALQGPKAAEVLSRFMPQAAEMGFMTAQALQWNGKSLTVTRSGYTGEDGYEISVPADLAETFAVALLDCPEVKPIGLGARDSLRLEAGLCLYGSDLDTETTPVEAALEFAIGKRRREEGGFPGADKIIAQLKDGAPRRRIGILLDGKAPARAGTPIVNEDNEEIGTVTSGTISPSRSEPIAMGYVETRFAETGAPIGLMVRGKRREGRVADMPFVPHRYYRKS